MADLVKFIFVCFLQLIVNVSKIYLYKLHRCFSTFPQTINNFLIIQSCEQEHACSLSCPSTAGLPLPTHSTTRISSPPNWPASHSCTVIQSMLQGSVCGFGGWLSHGGCLPAYTVLGQHEQAMEPDLWSQTCGGRAVCQLCCWGIFRGGADWLLSWLPGRG